MTLKYVSTLKLKERALLPNNLVDSSRITSNKRIHMVSKKWNPSIIQKPLLYKYAKLIPKASNCPETLSAPIEFLPNEVNNFRLAHTVGQMQVDCTKVTKFIELLYVASSEIAKWPHTTYSLTVQVLCVIGIIWPDFQ